VLDALFNEVRDLEPVNLYRLSSLGGEERELLANRWRDIPVRRRRKIVEDLEDIAEDDPLLCYEPIARIGLEDSDPDVRVVSIRMLWNEDSPGVEYVLLNMLENDLDERVRAGAGAALGHFVYQGELEEIPAKTLKAIEEQLLRTVNGKDATLVRRKALEALGFSSRPEVTGLIEYAFSSMDDDWVASALFAMGRSADNRWAGDVLRMLDDENALIRLEAARAAGELEIKRAGKKLVELLDDADVDVRAAAIWSISQIGGEGAAETLDVLLEDNEDEEEIALLEEALDNLAFNEGLGSFDLFDFDEDDLNELIEFEVDDLDSDDLILYGDEDEDEDM
jgi:hypothetical protein